MIVRRILPLFFCLFVIVSARASNDLFLDIAGVQGESRDQNHPNQIEVLSWSWGMSHPPGSPGSGGSVQIQDLSISKYTDKSSPLLMLACSKGTTYPTVKLNVRKAGGTRDYLVITLTDVIVTSVSTGGSGGQDRFTENLTLNFTKVKVEYYEQKPDGSYNPTPVTYTWNILTNSET